MTRRYDTLGRKIMRVLHPENGGPRKRTVLLGLAGSEKRLQSTLGRLMASGHVVMIGDWKGALYALGKRSE